MIEIRNLNKNYRSKKALDDISFTLENQTYGLLGPNGSGKTTLLRIMTHVLEGKGDIVFKDKEGNKKEFKELKIGYLPQKFGLYKEMKLKDQMDYFACLKDISKEDREKEITRVLEAVNLEEEVDKRCGDLSGGMTRRVGIAQALLGQPDLILFDEPTVGLDPEERLRFKSILAEIHGNCPIVLSTHIVEDVESVCNCVLILRKGKIVFDNQISKLIEYSKNRVYEIEMNEFIKLDTKQFYKIKVFERNNQQYARVILLNQELKPTYQNVEETVEDGYMYLLKGSL